MTITELSHRLDEAIACYEQEASYKATAKALFIQG